MKNDAVYYEPTEERFRSSILYNVTVPFSFLIYKKQYRSDTRSYAHKFFGKLQAATNFARVLERKHIHTKYRKTSRHQPRTAEKNNNNTDNIPQCSKARRAILENTDIMT